MKNLSNQGTDIFSNTADTMEACNDLESLISVIEEKFQITKEQDLEIVEFIRVDCIKADTTGVAEFEFEVEKGKCIIINFLDKSRPKDNESFKSLSDSLNVSRLRSQE